MSGSGISWAICKSAPRFRQTTTPALHHSSFYRPDALPATQPTASKHWRQFKIRNQQQNKMFTDVCTSLQNVKFFSGNHAVLQHMVAVLVSILVLCRQKSALWTVNHTIHCLPLFFYTAGWLSSHVVSTLDSGAVRPGFKSQPRCCRVTVLGKLFTPIVPLYVHQAAKLAAALCRAAWVTTSLAAYRRVYDSRHLQADCQELGSAPEPYAGQSSMGYLFIQ